MNTQINISKSLPEDQLRTAYTFNHPADFDENGFLDDLRVSVGDDGRLLQAQITYRHNAGTEEEPVDGVQAVVDLPVAGQPHAYMPLDELMIFRPLVASYVAGLETKIRLSPEASPNLPAFELVARPDGTWIVRGPYGDGSAAVAEHASNPQWTSGEPQFLWFANDALTDRVMQQGVEVYWPPRP